MNFSGNAARDRGFASMDRARQREIASMGGRAAHRQGLAHQFTSDEARAAGRKGGEAVSANRAHMALIGRKGGEASRRRAAIGRFQNGINGLSTTASEERVVVTNGSSVAEAVV
ncbi:MAG TPA: KGG domain-containing protein [Rhodanobacteraceae bacterium]|jgi:hypothetical protein